ncbi:carboxypeptidase regulatory-like domain-containing protein [Bacillus sp. H-16]|uniref:carboxypeptidase-like regulatory domain-containing protein n=1 Tax=Alteribacter salitolerans TaxID=2912333 RepID=UPI001963F07D|nr:carboxypeptidase-like regulatory domain-containing protein [Alteribacter salitolerans]MBM7095245.1 carboxypeptidase regulatory-like domain-containing protein [Alteribacter salitolerans]
MNGWMKKGLLFVFVFVMMGSVIAGVHAEGLSNDDLTGVQFEEGRLKDGMQDLKHTAVLIQSQTNPSVIHQRMTDQMGNLYADLPDGQYKLKGLHHGSHWYTTEQVFTIEEGMIGDSKGRESSLTKNHQVKGPAYKGKKNVNGQLLEGTSGLQGDLLIGTISETEEEIVTLSTNKKGQFSASLADGEYFIFGVSVNGGLYKYERMLTVEGNNLYVDGEKQTSLTVAIPERSYSGVVKDSKTPLEKAGIIIERVGAGYSYDEEDYDEDYGYDYGYEFIEFTYTNRKGEYDIRALEDGTYSLSVFHDTYYAWETYLFDVADGALYIDGEEVSRLDVAVPDMTLKGTLFDNGKKAGHGYVEIERHEEDGHWYDYFSVPVDKKGDFSYRLADGSYTVTFVEERYRSTSVDLPFEIKDGKIIYDGSVRETLDIPLPPITFSGRLLDDGKALNGYVNVEGETEDGVFSWYGGKTDKKGVFSLRLKDGFYEVSWVYLLDEHEEFYARTSFEMKDGQLYVNGEKQKMLDIDVPPVSLHGIVLNDGVPVGDGEIVVVSEDGDYVWKWLNDDGTFSMRLSDGKYSVREVYLFEDGTSAFLMVPFDIVNGKTIVDGKETDRLEIHVPPVSVTGYLLEDGESVPGEVMITPVDDEYNSIWSYTNENNMFSLRLSDGDFEVQNVYLEDGTSFRTHQPFSVKDGQLVIDGEPAEHLEIIVQPVTLSGSVYKGDTPVQEGYVSVASANEEDWYDSWIEGGAYRFRLSDGDYRVLAVDSWDSGYAEFDLEFEIKDGKLLVGGKERDTLDLDLNEGQKP